MAYTPPAVLTPARRWQRRSAFALIPALIAGVVGLGVAQSATAATGAVGSLSLVVVSDGSAPFDGDANAAGRDSGPSNGLVRTHDTMSYRWDYSVATPGDVTFTQELPNGLWTDASAAACVGGAAAISADRHTLTCTLPNRLVGSGSYTVSAVVSGTAANGTLLQTSVSADTVTSNQVSTTVTAATAMDVSMVQAGLPIQKAGPGAFAATQGWAFYQDVELYAPIDATNGIRGRQAIQSPLTFTVTPPATMTTAVISDCRAMAYSESEPLPTGGTEKTTNQIKESGTWTCSQPGGPGTPITVTVTGADSTLDVYPTLNKLLAPVAQGKAYFGVGRVVWWVSDTQFGPGIENKATTRLESFDPVGIDGGSNYGDGYAPGQDPNDTSCVTAFPNESIAANCVNTVVDTKLQKFNVLSLEISKDTTSTALFPGASGLSSGDGPGLPGQTFGASWIVANPNVSGVDFHDATSCVKWDPALVTIDASVKPNLTTGYIIEYGTTPYANNDERRNGPCGIAGNGDPSWFSSVAAAGGESQVTAIRVTRTTPLPGGGIGTVIRLQFGMKRTAAAIPVGTSVPLYGSAWAQEVGLVPSYYNENVHTNSIGGNRLIAADALVRASTDWDAATGSPGTTHQITVQPTVTSTPGGVAKNTQLQVQLPNPCVSYLVGSAPMAPSVIPADLGPDGVACTADDGAGQLLTFALGDLPENVQPAALNFQVVLSSRTPAPTTAKIVTTIASESDPTRAAVRTSTDTILLNSPAEFTVMKTASTAAALSNRPFDYTVSWANRMNFSAGRTSVVDVLPFPNDPRGSTLFGSLSIDTIDASAGVTVEYSTMNPTLALSALATDASGDTGAFNWSSTPNPNATVIRFVQADLPSGAYSSAVVRVIPQGVLYGGSLVNDLYSKASALEGNVTGVGRVTVPAAVSASLSATLATTTNSYAAPGDVLKYTATIQNTGNATLSGLNLAPAEGMIGDPANLSISCPTGPVASGAKVTCTLTYPVTQADLDRGNVKFAINAVAIAPDATEVSAKTAQLDVRAAVAASLRVTGSANPTVVSGADEPITFTYVVENTGNVTVSSIALQQVSFTGSATPSALDCGSASLLAPGQTATCTATYVSTQADADSASLVQRVRAVGTNPALAAVQSPETSVTVAVGSTAALSFVSSVSSNQMSAAKQQLTFTYSITNTGTKTLRNIGVEQLRFTGSGTAPAVTCDAGAASLAPKAEAVCTATYTVTQADIDARTIVQETRAYGSELARALTYSEPELDEIVSTAVAALQVAPVASNAEATEAGKTVSVDYTVTNVGAASANTIALAVESFTGSDTAPTATCAQPALALTPGAATTCTVTFVVSLNDLDAGEPLLLDVTASAVELGTDVTITQQAEQVSVPVTQRPELTLAHVATPNKNVVEGDTVQFTFEMTNTGNVTLTEPEPVSELFTGTDGPLDVDCAAVEASLAPGASTSCVADYVVAHDDMLLTSITDAAVAFALDPRGDLVQSVSVTAEALIKVTEPTVDPIEPTPTPTPTPTNTPTASPTGQPSPDVSPVDPAPTGAPSPTATASTKAMESLSKTGGAPAPTGLAMLLLLAGCVAVLARRKQAARAE